MAFTFNVEAKVEQIRVYLQNVLQLAGYQNANGSLPWAYALDQFEFVVTDCPLTLLQPGQVTTDVDKYAVGTTTYGLKLYIHHIRQRTAADLATFGVSNEEKICEVVLSSIGKAITPDRRMGGIVQASLTESLNVAGEKELEAVFTEAAQNNSLAACTLMIDITWNESIYQ